MQEELKNMLQAIITTEFSAQQTTNEQCQNFLKKMNLPMAIQGLTSNSSIPDTLWNKIQEFQKKGSTASFMNSIEANKNYFQLNNDILNAIMTAINEEEKADM